MNEDEPSDLLDRLSWDMDLREEIADRLDRMMNNLEPYIKEAE